MVGSDNSPSEWIRQARDFQSIGQPIRCLITGYLCQGDLSHLCKDYGCARKAGLSPDSTETF
jgi:hypothetical protein